MRGRNRKQVDYFAVLAGSRLRGKLPRKMATEALSHRESCWHLEYPNDGEKRAAKTDSAKADAKPAFCPD